MFDFCWGNIDTLQWLDQWEPSLANQLLGQMMADNFILYVDHGSYCTGVSWMQGCSHVLIRYYILRHSPLCIWIEYSIIYIFKCHTYIDWCCHTHSMLFKSTCQSQRPLCVPPCQNVFFHIDFLLRFLSTGNLWAGETFDELRWDFCVNSLCKDWSLRCNLWQDEDTTVLTSTKGSE